MQDTKNLKRKLKEYKEKILYIKPLVNDKCGCNSCTLLRADLFWFNAQALDIISRINSKSKNKLKNKKQFKKAN